MSCENFLENSLYTEKWPCISGLDNCVKLDNTLLTEHKLLICVYSIIHIKERLQFPFNSLRPSDTHMHQWTGNGLCLLSAYQAITWLSQCWLIIIWTARNKFLWKLNQNTQIFFQGFAFENIAKFNVYSAWGMENPPNQMLTSSLITSPAL